MSAPMVNLQPGVGMLQPPEPPKVEDHHQCCRCGQIERRGEEPEHVAVMGIRCPADRWIAIQLDEAVGAMAWRAFVARVTAVYASCPACGATVRVRQTGALLSHNRPRRPSDGRGRAAIVCEGSEHRP